MNFHKIFTLSVFYIKIHLRFEIHKSKLSYYDARHETQIFEIRNTSNRRKYRIKKKKDRETTES